MVKTRSEMLKIACHSKALISSHCDCWSFLLRSFHAETPRMWVTHSSMMTGCEHWGVLLRCLAQGVTVRKPFSSTIYSSPYSIPSASNHFIVPRTPTGSPPWVPTIVSSPRSLTEIEKANKINHHHRLLDSKWLSYDYAIPRSTFSKCFPIRTLTPLCIRLRFHEDYPRRVERRMQRPRKQQVLEHTSFWWVLCFREQQTTGNVCLRPAEAFYMYYDAA